MITSIFLNLGYLLILVAIAVRDMLWLRCLLMTAHTCLITSALITGNSALAFWNTIFILINTIRVIRLVRERRPIEIPQEFADLYEQLFAAWRPREFLYFWHTGTSHEICNDVIIQQGTLQENLSLILAGTVQVVKNRQVIAKLSRGHFIAEMSFLTGEPASADVVAAGSVKYLSWNQEKLRDLTSLNPALMLKLQNVLGKDLAEKMKAASRPEEENREASQVEE